MAVLAMDTIGHLPVTSKGNRWALTTIIYTHLVCLQFQWRKKSAENVVQAYLSSILANKGRCVAILSDNGTEFEKKVLSEVGD